jgi:hypothetical protein
MTGFSLSKTAFRRVSLFFVFFFEKALILSAFEYMDFCFFAYHSSNRFFGVVMGHELHIKHSERLADANE